MLVKLIVPCANAEVAITVHANNSTSFFIFLFVWLVYQKLQIDYSEVLNERSQFVALVRRTQNPSATPTTGPCVLSVSHSSKSES